MQNNDIARMSPLSFYSEALRLKLGHKISPRMAIIHPTNRCNHNCTGCEYANVHKKRSSEIEGSRLLKLINEIADLGTASILFSGGGEPTLHPSFGKVLEEAKKRRLLIGIFTNGSAINQQLAEVIAQNATFIRISVDASTTATYVAIRRIDSSAFDQLKSAVRRIVAAKDRLDSNLQIGLKFLVRPCNTGEIISFVSLANELGVESVQYKPIRNADEDLNPEQAQTSQRFIEQVKEQTRNVCPGIKVEGGVSAEIKVRVPCWITPLRVVVSAEGDVYLCNYFNHRRQTHTFGNINEKSLRDIWFSDAHRQALVGIRISECELYDCRFHELNAELLSLVEKCRHQLDFV